ncbi:MAG: hypothetical protein M3P83_08180, partial [Actinomycetota bacterium]|nr:hypothetical protein [Actinomycetota bacterium]
MQPSDAQIEQLRSRLARHPVDRYPVQHATAQFHLGTALVQVGEVDAALAALDTAESIFGACGLRLEQAKAGNMRGVALRATGMTGPAAAAFTGAVERFAELDRPVEHAAALYNLGLVRVDAGDRAGARTAFA